ncbi:DUF5103 domain-containing protein [Lutibacter holmesii]|uniref:DUF5103 domain-containing protein n=1 Tax=Lutibacter holmesii TaxID=1137985 RepID=A0ABW3WLF2_9FLAO
MFLCFHQLFFAQIRDAPNIKTVIFQSSNINNYSPIIQLGEKMMLSFDDLNANEQNYYYKISHCEIDWTPSKLIDSEYITGFSEDRIREFNNSFNTLLPYTNYELTIPNETTQIKISGNYILSILNDAREVVLQRRFIVYESQVTVAVGVYQSRDLKKIETHQSVQFTINKGNFIVNNPYQEIKTVLIQNNNWKTAIKDLKPQFFRNNQLLYLYDKETSYWAGNEFLYFDSKDIRSSTLNIARSEITRDIYDTYLYTNEERIDRPYTYAPDINGNFTIRTLDSDLPNIEADYTWVYFSLECLEDLSNKDVYVSGKFNNWALNESNKLQYNTKTGFFEGTILMKQGFYNYQYVTKDKNGVISNHDIDGSYFQTENDYTVIVYYKKFGSRYTKVIGMGTGNSKVILN